VVGDALAQPAIVSDLLGVGLALRDGRLMEAPLLRLLIRPQTGTRRRPGRASSS